MHHFIAYVSPAGTTRTVAQSIAQTLQELGISQRTFDLSRYSRGISPGASLGKNTFLWIGSPVYALHPVPLVLEFLQSLPQASSSYNEHLYTQAFTS